MGQTGNTSIAIEKQKNISLTAITEKFNFVFLSEPYLIFHKFPPNHSLVNVYKAIMWHFIISFFILYLFILLWRESLYYKHFGY